MSDKKFKDTLETLPTKDNHLTNGESLNIVADQLEKLKQLFPEAITEGKIDWEKLQATLGKENLEFRNERYVLNWAGKSDAFKVLQQTTTATLKPQPDQSINFDTTQNVFIEGENLEVLKVLQKAYYGKIKCITIDPPYNTGSDSFIYPDSFKESREEYQKRIGEKDEEGYLLKEGMFRKNSKDSGHFHSNWLSMMYPRLFLAKNLLRDDGVIFIHIDDNEVHNLRLLMNEIFGEENFIESFIWRRRKTQANLSKFTAPVHDYILCYAKKKDSLTFNRLPLKEEYVKKMYKNPDNDPRGLWRLTPLLRPDNSNNREYELTMPNGRKIKGKWSCSPETFKKYVDEKLLVVDEKSSPNKKIFLNENEGYLPNTWLDDIATNEEGAKEIETIFGTNAIFTFPKPSSITKHFLKIGCSKNDLILDFFAGSATTAQAVLEINKDGGNRKFILVQLPEKCDEESEAYKAGYKTIADISKERIRRVVKKIEKEKKENKNLLSETEENKNLDLGFKVFKLSSSNFKIWRGNEITEENLEQQLDAFTNPVREGSEKENMLYELILKAGYLLTDKVEAKKKYYSVNDGELIIALEEMNQKLIAQIISAKPKKVITLDKLFTDNDQLKTNAALQMRDTEIDFKTI